MPQKTHDQARLHAELLAGIDNGAVKPIDHRRERDPAGGMPLRVEEHLDVPDIVGVCAFEIGPGQVIEILLRNEHGHGLIVDVEKVLQVAESVRLPQRLDRRIGQADAVAARQREHHFGLEASFDVNVQLTFGEPLDQTVRVLHPYLLSQA